MNEIHKMQYFIEKKTKPLVIILTFAVKYDFFIVVVVAILVVVVVVAVVIVRLCYF